MCVNILNIVKKCNENILNEFQNLNFEEDVTVKITNGKNIINKILEDNNITDIIKTCSLANNKINIDLTNYYLKSILNEKEIIEILFYYQSGLNLNFYNFQNVIFYLEKIIRYLYLRIGISSARHSGNQILHYSELSNLIRKANCNGEVQLFFSSIMMPEGFNVRNKIVHGLYIDESTFSKDMFVMLLMLDIIINLKGVINEDEIEYSYTP